MDGRATWDPGPLFTAPLSLDRASHRNRTTASKVCRLVPLFLALLLAALLTAGVLVPLAHMWNGGTDTVLVNR